MVSINEQLGNYRLLRLLGRGGFAEVYLGQHLYLKSYAALKVLRTSLEDEEVTQFMTEAQTLARLVHPHIVRVLDFDVIRGLPVLVMEYSPGGTLRLRHPRGSSLSLETTVIYIKQIASALYYAHQHDVIHRDVKPENMLFGDQQEVRLSDFGIALLAPSPEQLSTQEMVGTIPYMAPEQLQGKPCLASDQYALGIVAYEWLCGVRPFEGNYWQLAYQHISSPPPSLREKDPSLPETVETVVLKALAKDPQHRYTSVQLFAQALEAVVQAGERDLRDAFEVTAPLRAVSPGVSTTTPSTPRRVFLSAFSNDSPFVARLSADLQARGITIWNAQPEATQLPGNERETLRQAMRAVDALLIVVSPPMPSLRVVKEHLQLAGIYKRPIIYIQIGDAEPVETLPLVESISIINAHPGRYTEALDEIVACLDREHSFSSGEEASLAQTASASRNPYKGLQAFRSDDASDFFGRDTLIAELTDQLRDMLSSLPSKSLRDRLLTVIGPSGSGKSSVVMAGLLPRLASGALPGSGRWVYLDSIVPGSHPIESLALALVPLFPNRSIKSIREDLEDDSTRGLHLLATQLVKSSDQKVILLVNQFEELFTLTTIEAERRQFIDLLVTAATEASGPLVLILTLRADFYDRPIRYPELGRLILRHQCLVLPMEMHELRLAVKQPAALPDVQLTFEGNLVGDLLYDIQGQPGALPLLQFTLDQLYRRRDGSMLTLKAYQEIGGVKGALAKHAEATYTELPSDKHRVLARSLFLRLIDPGFIEQDTTRRRAPLEELTLAVPEENELLQQATAYFLAARLLTSRMMAGRATVEVSHEALIGEWPRLSDWLWEAREDVRLQQAINEDVAEWEQRGKPNDRLYRGSQLKEAKVWMKRNTPNKSELAFIKTSASRRVRVLVSVLAIFLLLASTSGLAVWLFLHPTYSTTVTTLNDDGPGSLRQAIAIATQGSTIMFAPGLRGTILLTRSDLNIDKKITILGPGAPILTISGGNTINKVHILSGGVVDISDLSFGESRTGFPATGFIYNEGIVTLTSSRVSGNKNGFGIYNSGFFTLVNTTISNNIGGIFHDGFSGNGFQHGKLTLINSTVSANGCNQTIGISSGGRGALANLPASGGPGCAGGIESRGGTVTLINSTIADNTSYQGGGGIFLVGEGQALILFCTIYHNRLALIDKYSTTQADNIGVESQLIIMRNSLVGGNSQRGILDISGTLTTEGYNLIQNVSGIRFNDPHHKHQTDLSGIQFPDLKIDTVLHNNGGSTQTLALLAGSPAIDRIPLDACLVDSKLPTDQRGIKRPQGKACDIGAYEYVAVKG